MNRFLTIFLLVLSGASWGQTATSKLASGKWYKLSVGADAVYKIDYSFLQQLGLNPDAIDPRNLQLYAGQAGMLPQINSDPRRDDLLQTAIMVVGQEDGRFNNGDYILFFGEGPDRYTLRSPDGLYQYEDHLYADLNFYFLTVGTSPGKRVRSMPALSGSFPVVKDFDDFAYYEKNLSNILHSGRDWFGEVFDTQTEYTIRFDIPGIIPTSSLVVTAGVLGRSYAVTSFQLSLNGTPVHDISVPAIDQDTYAVKGAKVTDQFPVTAASIGAANQSAQDLRIRFNKAAQPPSFAYLDFAMIQSRRELKVYGDQFIFQSYNSLQQPFTQFEIGGMTTGGTVWDVTNPLSPRMPVLTVGSTTAFQSPTDSLRKFVVLTNKSYQTPTAIGVVANQNLHGIDGVELIIVTAPEFLTQANRLAAYRQQQGITVAVVTTTQVYNEFSGGKQDVTAIRDLARHVYNKGSGLKNLLLFGRGSFDYKNYLSYNKNFVPIYQSRNSVSPLETFSSDDYFGFLEPSEGNWGEVPVENHTMDIGVGRLPVKKAEEAVTLVDKIIQYESSDRNDWRKDVVFVADDGDFNIHQSAADALAEKMETVHPELNTKKLYLDAFTQVRTSIGQSSKEAATALTEVVRKGALIINYTGHGNEQQWAEERLVDQITVENWTGAPRYPFVVTATCEFGRNDDPGLISTAELSLLMKGGGSIGLVTTARPVNSTTNFLLNDSFYNALLTMVNGKVRPLGTVMKDTKNASVSGVANRNFSLLGDPSMRLVIPESSMAITQIINKSTPSDTLKALSRIQVDGVVKLNGLTDASFQGKATASLFDRPLMQQTKGDENPPLSYLTRDNLLFKGQGTVQNGQFSMSFVMPKAMAAAVGQGKISLFGTNQTGTRQVGGSANGVKVGAVEKNKGTDTTPPSIAVYMGDTTFLSGGITGRQTRLVARLYDINGINLSDLDPSTTLVAYLDDSLFSVSTYYLGDVNRFEHGTVEYPLFKVKPGAHVLKVRAADNFGNVGWGETAFYVTDANGITIEELFNYPNPVSASTTFRFKHSRSGEDIEAELTIFNITGQPVFSTTYLLPLSSYTMDLPTWDGTTSNGTKLGVGLYLARLTVRSLLDGSKNEKFAKVIVSN